MKEENQKQKCLNESFATRRKKSVFRYDIIQPLRQSIVAECKNFCYTTIVYTFLNKEKCLYQYAISAVRHSMNRSTSAVTLRDCIHEGKATAESKLQFEGMPICSLGSMIQAVRQN